MDSHAGGQDDVAILDKWPDETMTCTDLRKFKDVFAAVNNWQGSILQNDQYRVAHNTRIKVTIWR